MQITIFTANSIGQAANCSYPNRETVSTPEQLREVVKGDHVCAEYKGNYRGIGNFIRSDVIVMDIDNAHSEEPAEWITAEKLEEIFPDMEYMLDSSRHHLLPKEGKSARPRYHIYFPISEITDAKVYGNLKKALQKEYPFFDGNALDAARFIFGADCEEVLVHDGWMTIDEEIDVSQVAEEEDFDSEDSESASGGQILEGSRNNTMSRFAGRVLKRYGITEKAHEAFLEHAKKCDPPLPESELKTIWNSAVKFFKKSIVNEIVIHDQKLDALEDMIEAANGRPVMVAYWFKHDLSRIMRRLTEKKIPFEKLDSEESIRKWNRGELQVALIHPASAGHGLNL